MEVVVTGDRKEVADGGRGGSEISGVRVCHVRVAGFDGGRFAECGGGRGGDEDELIHAGRAVGGHACIRERNAE
jgi:hypothetical protein